MARQGEGERAREAYLATILLTGRDARDRHSLASKVTICKVLIYLTIDTIAMFPLFGGWPTHGRLPGFLEDKAFHVPFLSHE